MKRSLALFASFLLTVSLLRGETLLSRITGTFVDGSVVITNNIGKQGIDSILVTVNGAGVANTSSVYFVNSAGFTNLVATGASQTFRTHFWVSDGGRFQWNRDEKS